MYNKYLVSTSPHISSERTTKNIMQDVVIALIPAVIASILLYGFYPLVVVLLSVGGALAGESIYNAMRKRKNTIGDYSAVVTGVILGLNLPPVLPLYVPIIGGIFATLIVKMLFGGIGRNFANPAITARIFLLLAWGTSMTVFVPAINLSAGGAELFKYFKMSSAEIAQVASATPLSYLKAGNHGAVDLLNMFLGKIGGSAGEVSAIALLIGGVYLGVRKVIDIKIPLIYVGTVAILALAFYGDIGMVLPSVLGGGLLFGAIFMATDYSTSPNTTLGIVIYAVGCGLLTMIFRRFGRMAEGVSFAILLMNIITPLLDKYISPKPFGYVKPEKPVKEKKAEEVKA